MQHTSEQRAAIHIQDENLLVVAGAGSGKTRVLVERYIELLASHSDWPISALVAITFTREAAFEMRQRLRLELERRARADGDERWARHLAQMDSARIDTIHGLCADLLRANAAQAGVDPKFEVLDETEAAILLDEVVADELAAIELPLARLFALYDAWRIEGELRRMSLINGDYPALELDAEALFQRWHEQWAALVDDERKRLLASEQSAKVEAIDYLPAGDKLADVAIMYRDYFERLAQDDIEAVEILDLLQTLRKEGAAGNKGSIKTWGSKEAKNEASQSIKGMHTRIKETLDAIGDPPGAVDRLTAEVLPLWGELLSRTRHAYRQRKADEALLDFDDLERLAAELLRDPAARDRYRNAEFKHLLVDEFQDTNAAQWRIIRSLADLSCGGTLFAVGDPKQSIYQFRGADVSVFNRERARFGNLEACRELPLSMSFRSHLALVEQFNALFASILDADVYSPARAYEVAFDQPMAAFREDSPAAPALELQLLDYYACECATRKGDYRSRDKRGRKQTVTPPTICGAGKRSRSPAASKT